MIRFLHRWGQHTWLFKLGRLKWNYFLRNKKKESLREQQVHAFPPRVKMWSWIKTTVTSDDDLIMLHYPAVVADQSIITTYHSCAVCCAHSLSLYFFCCRYHMKQWFIIFFYASGVLFLYLQRLSQVCRSCCDECIGDTGGLTHRSSRLIINRNRFTRRSSRELRRTNINVLVYVLDTLFIWVSGCLRTIFISFFPVVH